MAKQEHLFLCISEQSESMLQTARSASNYRRVIFNLICRCGGTADALVSGSSEEIRVGSNPVTCTRKRLGTL